MLQAIRMFKAIGVVLILWYLSSVFTQTFSALDDTMTASLQMVEAAALHSRYEIEK